MAMPVKLPPRPVKLPPKPMTKSVSTAKPGSVQTSPEPKAEKSKGKSVTVRMPDNHIEMLEHCNNVLDCGNSETIKRAVRLLHSALSATDAELIVRSGAATETIPLMRKGMPTS